MEDPILHLEHLSKIFIIGKHKNAKLAQDAIKSEYQRLREERSNIEEGDLRIALKKLRAAEELFSNESFEESYRVLTGKSIAPRDDHGIVVHALNNVTLSVKEGELTAIVGPSGSGKSTLLNMLGLLDEPSMGEIFLRGREVTAIKSGELPEVRSRELGFVFQSFNLIPSLTALENVMLPLKYAGVGAQESKERAAGALERVGMSRRLHHNPNELSGGQQQRVAIARSIVGNPAILFGDELTGELDSKMAEDIMNLIVELNKKGQTIIIVTHNPEVAARCSRVIHMLDGRIEKEVRKQPSLIPAPNTLNRSRKVNTSSKSILS